MNRLKLTHPLAKSQAKALRTLVRLSHLRGYLPYEMDDVDEHMRRYEHMQPISTTFDVELSDSGEHWRKSAFTGFGTLEEAGRHLDKMAGLISGNMDRGFGTRMPMMRVTKVITHLEFEHVEVSNGALPGSSQE